MTNTTNAKEQLEELAQKRMQAAERVERIIRNTGETRSFSNERLMELANNDYIVRRSDYTAKAGYAGHIMGYEYFPLLKNFARRGCALSAALLEARTHALMDLKVEYQEKFKDLWYRPSLDVKHALIPEEPLEMLASRKMTEEEYNNYLEGRKEILMSHNSKGGITSRDLAYYTLAKTSEGYRFIRRRSLW